RTTASMRYKLCGLLATAVASLCLMAQISLGPASAANPAATGNEDGSMMCGNCKPAPNTVTTTGTATGGSVTQNPDGSANALMVYNTPNDGDTYSGTSQVIIKDGNGNTITNVMGSVYNVGDGGQQLTGLSNIYIPVGANVYINVKEMNASNTKSFSGSYH